MISNKGYYETKKHTRTSGRKKVVATFASISTVPKMMMMILLVVLYLQILLFAKAQQQEQQQQQKTRSLPRVTTPEEVWKHIKIRTVDELKEILEKLEINIEGDDDIDFDDEDELRTYIYDEEIMELWLKTYPEEVMRLKPPPPPSPKQEDPPVVPPSDSSSSSTNKDDDQNKKTNPIENLIQSGSKFMKNLWGGNKDEL